MAQDVVYRLSGVDSAFHLSIARIFVFKNAPLPLRTPYEIYASARARVAMTGDTSNLWARAPLITLYS
jgi:hypothetical protein